jgi:hypothetical protein
MLPLRVVIDALKLSRWNSENEFEEEKERERGEKERKKEREKKVCMNLRRVEN